MAGLGNIRVAFGVPWPARVQGSGFVSVTKANGIWTVGVDITKVSAISPQISDYPTTYVIAWNALTSIWERISLQDLQSLPATTPTPVIDAAVGDYNVTTERILLINKTVPAAHNINLPAAAGRSGLDIFIKDVAGNAAANIATIVPNGAELIDGKANIKINANYGGYRIAPRPAPLTGWYIRT